MSISQLVIFDFDGTCTNVEEEGKGFVEALIDTLAQMTAQPRDVIAAYYEEGEERLRAEADDHGWIVNGITVAPAIVDPYLRSKPIQRWILERCNITRWSLEARVSELNGELFRTHYAQSSTALREDLRNVLEALHAVPTIEIIFVTNSDTDAVRKKLATLGLNWNPRVIGNAKKYIAEPGTELHIPGLTRGILLNRPHYRAVLEQLRREYGARPDQMTVIGDIYELDLAVPDHLGMRTALMVGPNTPDYERTYMLESNVRRRAIVNNLTEALGFIMSARS